MNQAFVLFTHLTDKELISHIKAGEIRFFEVLVRRHIQAMYRIAKIYFFASEEAEELLERMFLKVFSNFSIPDYTSFRSWITQKMLAFCMENRGNSPFEGNSTEPSCHAVRPFAYCALAGREDLKENPEPETPEGCVCELSLPARSVYILSEIDGFRISEIASFLKISQSEAFHYLEKAKSVLYKSLRKWHYYGELFPLEKTNGERIVEGIMKNINSPTYFLKE